MLLTAALKWLVKCLTSLADSGACGLKIQPPCMSEIYVESKARSRGEHCENSNHFCLRQGDTRTQVAHPVCVRDLKLGALVGGMLRSS